MLGIRHCEILAREVKKIKTRPITTAATQELSHSESVKANQVSDLWAQYKNQNSAHCLQWG